MAFIRADIKIRVDVGDRNFTINAVRLPNRRYLVRRGRSRSEKTPVATLTEIFEISRQWAVSQA